MELLRISKDKRALKFCKKRVRAWMKYQQSTAPLKYPHECYEFEYIMLHWFTASFCNVALMNNIGAFSVKLCIFRFICLTSCYNNGDRKVTFCPSFHFSWVPTSVAKGRGKRSRKSSRPRERHSRPTSHKTTSNTLVQRRKKNTSLCHKVLVLLFQWIHEP